VHAEGLVLRDLSPNNVMIAEGGDLEMLARPGDRVVRAYTPGYGAPEQVDAPRPIPAPGPQTDLYSLGAVLFFLATGIDPVLPADQPPKRTTRQRIRDWLAHLAADNPAAARLAPVVAALLHEDPARRPGLGAVRTALAAPRTRRGPATEPPRQLGDAELEQAIIDATDHLLAAMEPGRPRLWPAEGFAATTDPYSVQHGAAGVLGVLTRAYRARPDARLRQAVTTTAGWIAGRVGREPRTLPGLYFGRSGTAWALLEAGMALGDDELTGLAGGLARAVPLHWPNPDVCHGMAGAGLTQANCNASGWPGPSCTAAGSSCWTTRCPVWTRRPRPR
jgi:hypothetical protein